MNDHITKRARALIREAMNLGAEHFNAGSWPDWRSIEAAVKARRKVLVAKVETLMRNQK